MLSSYSLRKGRGNINTKRTTTKLNKSKLHFTQELLDLCLRLFVEFLILFGLLLCVAQFLELGLELLVLCHKVSREALGEAGSPGLWALAFSSHGAC